MEPKIKQKFGDVFGQTKPVYCSFAPGRVNLIGEHVDYMGGTVLPACTTQGVSCYCNPRVGGRGSITVHCTADDSTHIFSSALVDDASIGEGWNVYVRGIILEVLKKHGNDTKSKLVDAIANIPSCYIMVDGNVPVGAGMSSSAAFCVSLWNTIGWIVSGASPVIPKQSAGEKLEVALKTRSIEVDYCGANIGIMDQFVSVHGSVGCCIELDCSSLTYTTHRLPSFLQPGEQNTHTFLLVNSMKKHKLGNQYNNIRNCIERAQRAVAKHFDLANSEDGAESCRKFSFADVALQPSEWGFQVDSISSLGDAVLSLVKDQLSQDEKNMGTYVIDEMRRTQQFIKCLKDLVEMEATASSLDETSKEESLADIGRLLSDTHQGLSKQLMVSTEQLDFIQEFCVSSPGCLGGRLMGGGFGGCVLLLVESSRSAELIREVQEAFQTKFPDIGTTCGCIQVFSGGGAHQRMIVAE